MEFYGFFDSIEGDEREYDAAQFAHLLRAGMQNGVTSHRGGGLKVTAPGTGMTTQIGAGGCMLNGYLFVLEDDGGGARSFSHGASGSADRWDRIVVRLDTSADARKIVLEVKEGTPGAIPKPPALERSGSIYELSLAKVRIRAGAESIEAEDVTDERGDEAVCGYAVPVWLKGLTDFEPGKWEEALAKKAAVSNYTATLTAEGWTATAPYTQEVTVTGILESDTPIVDVNMAGATAENYGDLAEGWAAVGRIATGAGKITAYCYEEKPGADLPLLLKAVR